MSRRRVMMMLFGFSSETKAFISRVKADGGLIESAQCIDRKLNVKFYSTTTTNFIDRVLADSGKTNSPQCIDEKLQLT